MICPNLKDKQVKQKFEELVDALGEPLAYLTYSRNKGNFLEHNPDGSESTSFKQLLEAVDGDRKKALQLRSKYFTFDNISEKKVSKLQYDYSNDNISEQSKEARNNAKIDILWSVLTNSDTFEKIFKPGGFPTLQSLAKRVLELEGRADEMLDPLLPNTQAELYRRNMTGKALIGIFANHNANHAVLQYTDVELTSPIFFDGVSKVSLHDIKNSNGEFISRNVAEFLAAVVDNAKEPLSAFININTYTADVAALLTRLGFPLETVVGFLSQPILKEFTNLYFNNGANKQAESFAISQLQTRKVDKIELNTKDLFDSIRSKETTSDYQLAVLQQFIAIKEQATALADLVRAMRADTKGAGPTLSENEKLILLKDKVLKDTRLKNVEAVLNGEVYPISNAFMTEGIEKPTEVLSEYFPWMNPAFKEIKTIIQDNLKGKDLTVQQIEKINYELLGFAASGFEFFNGNDREDILFNLPKQLKEFKENNKEFVDENPFLKKLLYRTADEIKTTDRQKKKGKVYIDRIEFKNTGSLTDAEKVEVQNAWKDLFVKNEELANKLVKYTFYTSGFQLTPQSFGHLVPVQFYSTLKDSNGDSFNNYLDNIIDESKESEKIYKNSGFIDQFYRNNWDDTSFVPSVDITPNSRNISSDIVFVGDVPVAFEVDSNDKNTRQDFVLEKDKNGATFIPYIKYNYKGTVYLFKASPTQNPWIFQYDVIEKLGIPNYMMEYSRTTPILESVVADNILPDEVKGVEVSSDIPKAVDTVSITEEELEERIKLCNPE